MRGREKNILMYSRKIQFLYLESNLILLHLEVAPYTKHPQKKNHNTIIKEVIVKKVKNGYYNFLNESVNKINNMCMLEFNNELPLIMHKKMKNSCRKLRKKYRIM